MDLERKIRKNSLKHSFCMSVLKQKAHKLNKNKELLSYSSVHHIYPTITNLISSIITTFHEITETIVTLINLYSYSIFFYI